MNEKTKGDPVLWTSFFQQRKSLEKLIEESRADGDFYFFLSVSTFITTLGILIDSVVVVIGGMLVAPLLFPILSLAMGITTSSKDSIYRSLDIIGKSVVFVLAISAITALFFGRDVVGDVLFLAAHPNLEFFLIAFAAGLAAAYSWVKQNLSASLPGVAISVALLPPLAAVGVSVVYSNTETLLGAITLFVINLFGIAVAGIVVFSLFGFSLLKNEEEHLIKEELVEDLVKTKVRLEKTKEDLENVTEKIAEQGPPK